MSDKRNERGAGTRKDLLPALKSRLGERNHLSEEDLASVASELGLSPAEVYGTATFYSRLPVEPRGRYVIRVCRCLPCHMKNAPRIIEVIMKELGIVPGEITSDGLFSIELSGCLGACDRAPALMVNDELHAGLDAEAVVALLRSLRKTGAVTV